MFCHTHDLCGGVEKHMPAKGSSTCVTCAVSYLTFFLGLFSLFILFCFLLGEKGFTCTRPCRDQPGLAKPMCCHMHALLCLHVCGSRSACVQWRAQAEHYKRMCRHMALEPAEVSAMLLRHLVRQAERFLDEDVGGAVSNLILFFVLV
jgi:hypothetical protein